MEGSGYAGARRVEEARGGEAVLAAEAVAQAAKEPLLAYVHVRAPPPTSLQ